MKSLLLAIAIIIALTLRLVNALFIPCQGGDLIVSDMKGYDRAAMALVQQEPLGVHTAEKYLFHPLGSDTYHPPGYYYFLAGIYAVAGHSYVAVRSIQALVDTLTCVLIYLLGKEVFGETAGMLAATLAAVYPPLIFYTGVLLTESVTTCLLAGAAWVLLRCSRTRQHLRPVLLILAGLLLGLAIITRSVLLFSLPFVLIWLLFVADRWPGWKAATRYALALLVPVVLIIAPITIRNYQIHSKFILISTNGGVNFFLGHGGTERLKNKVRNMPEVFSEGEIIGISSRTQPEEEAYFYRLGWEYIRGHVLPTLRSLPDKLNHMYWASDYWPASEAQANLLRSVDLVFWRLMILPLSFVGLLLFRGQKRRRSGLLYLLILSTVAIPVVFWAQSRFRMPVVPCFVALAAGTVYELYCCLTRKGESALERTAL
jgi:4-amino-4-deoxy-L-arabinose transferase-like glycosyltransferase